MRLLSEVMLSFQTAFFNLTVTMRRKDRRLNVDLKFRWPNETRIMTLNPFVHWASEKLCSYDWNYPICNQPNRHQSHRLKVMDSEVSVYQCTHFFAYTHAPTRTLVRRFKFADAHIQACTSRFTKIYMKAQCTVRVC